MLEYARANVSIKVTTLVIVRIIVVIIIVVLRAPPCVCALCFRGTTYRRNVCLGKVNGNAYLVFKGNICLIHGSINGSDSF